MKRALVSALALLGLANAQATANLVVNGDFEAGNTGFTSAYSYQQAVNTPLVTGGASQYTVTADVPGWNSQWVGPADHTPGSGTQMFLANGSAVVGAVVWEETVNVAANTNYFFEAWVMNTCCNSSYSGPNSPAILTFMINGTAVGTRSTSLAYTGTWEGLSNLWNSGSATTAQLQLLNAQIAMGGNDFAVDDISLSTVSTVPSAAVPEPATPALVLLGLGLAAGLARRRSAR